MSERIVYLNLPEPPPAAVTAAPAVIIGNHYQPGNAELPGDLHGLCGGIDYTTQYGRVLPPSLQCCYLWDIDEELRSTKIELKATETESISLADATNVITSRFVLSHAAISEPQIINQESTPQLTTTAGFDFIFSTSMQTVQLGVLNLVETQRFAMLKNGERNSILDSGDRGPVLYLADDMETEEVVMPILQAGAGTDTIQHRHDVSLSQIIPENLSGSEIETLTVLEQYTSFFMQRELPFCRENIWTPVCAPICWGWSMRVARRQDGDWCIVRQKLLMPTVGHNGLEMPVWQGNQLHR